MKDDFDLWVVARRMDFDGETLGQAIRATFQRRATPIPEGIPFGLTDAFAEDPQKQIQWRAFLTRNALEAVPLADVAGAPPRFSDAALVRCGACWRVMVFRMEPRLWLELIPY
jgi:hypothetical protein